MNVFITGGSKGIGRAIALRFAEQGNHIFINYAHDDQAAIETASEIKKCGAIPHTLKADVGQVKEIHQMLKVIRSTVDQLDLIVHCAIAPIAGGVFDVSSEEWLRAVQISLSLIEVARESLPLLKDGSTIIALSSRGATNALRSYAAIGSPKALTESIVRYLVLELAPLGVRVNVVAPGDLYTEAYHQAFPNAEEQLCRAIAATPDKKTLTFDDVTDTIAFLASPQARMIQGRVIPVDGGLFIK
ncbi:SDR family oxidoreductase [Peribacillus frigoritolerans]|uniref:SDR family oxidoreductase n=1 Tax=Peribacillus frigoritolerans TaxID=450367 RepID=UPI0038023AC1